MYYFKYISKRIGFVLLSLFCIFTIDFFLLKSIEPQGTFDQIANQVIKMKREAMGYNKPIIEQYFIYLKGIFTKWDFGVTFNNEFAEPGTPVTSILFRRFAPTVVFNIYCDIVIIPSSIFLGILAAVKKGKWIDTAINLYITIFIAIPFFVLAIICKAIFSTGGLNWVPRNITVPLNPSLAKSWFTFDVFKTLLFPIAVVSIGGATGYTRTVRAELCDQISQEYMLLAHTKGLTMAQTIYRHALKNAMVPIFPSLLTECIALLGGSMLVEQIFGIPGTGQLMLTSITLSTGPDYNVFLFCVIFFTTIGLIGSIIHDVSMGIIDPRIKMGAR